MILVNGSEQRGIDPADRGLSYGDGLFETVAVADGRTLEWDAHLDRLKAGCVRLGIPLPDAGVLAEEAACVVEGGARGVLKIILTRGCGGRGYRPPADPHPTRILALYPWPDYPLSWYREGIDVGVCSTRLGRNPALAGLKHLNRLEQVMARREWADPSIAEGLMLDDTGCVVEGTMSNLFVVRDGKLVTPDLDQCGVAGIVRANVLKRAPLLGLEVQVAHLGLDDVLSAQEAFLSNSVLGVCPIRKITGPGGQRYQSSEVAGRMRVALEQAGSIAAL